MRIGVKPGQIGLGPRELRRCWREAEEAGFESIWTFDHLTGALIHEPLALLAAMAVLTSRARIGCLVLIDGLRKVETLAAQLATIDALSGGRLEVGLGCGDAFARQDFDALGLPFPDWPARLALLRATLDALSRLTSAGSPLGARPVQARLPLILGGGAEPIRRLARERGCGWNLSTASVDRFVELSRGQADPQVQVFLSKDSEASVPELVAGFREAGATRLVFVMQPPIEPGDIARLARAAGL